MSAALSAVVSRSRRLDLGRGTPVSLYTASRTCGCAPGAACITCVRWRAVLQRITARRRWWTR